MRADIDAGVIVLDGCDRSRGDAPEVWVHKL